MQTVEQRPETKTMVDNPKPPYPVERQPMPGRTDAMKSLITARQRTVAQESLQAEERSSPAAIVVSAVLLRLHSRAKAQTC